MGNARQFQLELEKFLDTSAKTAVEHQVDIVMTLFDAIVNRNPVGNPSRWKKPRKGYVGGQSRRNWRVSLRFPARNVLSGRDQSGRVAIGEAETTLRTLRQPTDLWISNPMPYMDRLESGDWSRQAPAGIVAIAAREVAAAFGLRYRP